MKHKGLILGVFVLLSACGNNDKEPQQIVRKVKIEAVQQADSLLLKSYSGSIEEAGEVNLAFRVAGPVLSIPVKEGDYVKQGQLVAQMDPRDYEIQLAAARAQYEQVKAEADRVIELHKRQSVAGNDYDKAVAGLQMVEAKLKNAQDQLNDTRLHAPVSGYIQKINFLKNELIDAGMPIMKMIDVGHYLVEVEIPVSLYVNRQSIVSFSGFQPTASSEPFPLQLVSVAKKAGNNQLYKVQLRLNPSSQPQLAPGMDVEVKIALENNGGPMTCVPLTALFSEKGASYVWVYMPGGTVQKREVKTGKLTGDGRIRIEQGLEANEKIVVAGVNSLNENDRVEPMAPVTKTNIGGLL